MRTSRRRLAYGLFGLFVAMLVLDVVFHVLAARAGTRSISSVVSGLGFVVMGSLFPIVGVILATRRPENALGWIMLVIGLFVVEPSAAIGEWLIATGHPAGVWALAGDSFSWVPVIGLAGIYVLLLFPDGHLPSPRWRGFAWTVGVGMLLTSFAIQFSPGDLRDAGFPNLHTPYAIPALRPLVGVAFVALVTIPAGIVGAALSLVVRYRRASGTERLQIRWLATAAIVVAALYAVAMALSLAANAGWAGGEGGIVTAVQNVAVTSFVLIPVSIGFAVLRYRLYEIDVVIRKAVIVAAIALIFTAIYVGVVGGIGALVEAHSTTTLSFVAAAIVALVFQPVIRRTRRLADRIVYGKRATPYELLSAFAERLGGTYAAEDVLPRMARIVAEGVGADRALVWIRRDGSLEVAAAWPSEDRPPPPVELEGGALPSLPGDAAFAIEDRGQLLGALSVSMPASDPIDEAKAKLIADLAGQAGLVLRNVGLTAELRRRLEELQAAQRRLVTAQDRERRKLERNIHDGAQQQLVALTVKLRLAEQLADQDPAKAKPILAALQADTQAALEDLRDLARGIYPPLLADQGLAPALQSQARKSPVPVEVSPDGIGRYDPAVEAAVYFSCLEALQNVAKYAEATTARVELSEREGRLIFSVADDGRGFDPDRTGYGTGLQGIADRLGALEGTLAVRSAPGGGTTIVGSVPVGGRA